VSRVVFLLEESSMREFLSQFLPRIAPDLDFLCVPHEGKRDLEKSIPRKIRAFRGVSFVVLRDNDGADCRVLKARLRRMCEEAGRPQTLIRIPCQELESWYLGTPETLAQVYKRPRLADLRRKAKYRNPDSLGAPSKELARLVPEFRKRDGARRIGAAIPLDVSANSSPSFRVFAEGLRRLTPAV
jgi:hypothetical protein